MVVCTLGLEIQPEDFATLVQAIREATHHVHLEFFIFQPDELGRQVLELLAQKAGQGVQVRFLVDLDAAARWQAEGALKRRSVPPQLKAYLGKSA